MALPHSSFETQYQVQVSETGPLESSCFVYTIALESLITITFHVSINISDKSVNRGLKSYVTDKITSINSILWVLNPLCVMCTSRH